MWEAYVNFISFTFINCLKWPRWLRPWTISLFEGFNHVKNTGVLICDLLVSGVLWCYMWGTYPLNPYMVLELFEGHIRWWSKFEASTTASDFCFLHLLFLSTFEPRRLLYYVRSICFSEKPFSFHVKMFSVALATSFLRSREIQPLFAVLVICLSIYFGLCISLFSITGSIPFISMCALFPATLWDLGKLETKMKVFSHAYALFHYALVWSRKIRNIEENI